MSFYIVMYSYSFKWKFGQWSTLMFTVAFLMQIVHSVRRSWLKVPLYLNEQKRYNLFFTFYQSNVSSLKHGSTRISRFGMHLLFRCAKYMLKRAARSIVRLTYYSTCAKFIFFHPFFSADSLQYSGLKTTNNWLLEFCEVVGLTKWNSSEKRFSL